MPIGEGAVVSAFSYDEAFSRNLGWVTGGEQQTLRTKKVAIAGMGGVGGWHLLTLARLGIGAFHIADFDVFELANFNRQAGATMSSLGQPKAETMARMAWDINPALDQKIFPNGIDEANLDAFLSGVDVYVDSLDFFVLDLRRKLFARCDALGVPVIIAAPIGMGTGYLLFKPGGMTFEQYFRLAGLSPERQRVNWALGLTPRGFQRSYLMDLSRVDLKSERGPSTSIACVLCAGVAAAEVLKILLKRGRVRWAPWYHQFDAYSNKWVRGWLPGGNRNPLQRAKLALGYRLSARFSRDALPSSPARATDLEAMLDQARWAPSGDNVQPWRFEIVDESRLVVHVQDTGDVYDYNHGEPTLLAAGFLLETLRIAASGRNRSMGWTYLEQTGDIHRIAVDLHKAHDVVSDELLPFLAVRSVDRRALLLTPLTAEQKTTLSATLGGELGIEWQETLAERWRAALINARATDIRLRIPEAFQVHQRVVDWERNFSPTGIPGAAIGLDPVARRLTRWLMQRWSRIDGANRLGGTILARLEMDLIPGLFCAAHFTVRATVPPQPGDRTNFLLATGQALQRFWLTATRLGLAMQPSLAPLCFAQYGRERYAFTEDRHCLGKAARLAALLDRKAAGSDERVVFMGRLGTPGFRRITSRSIRRSLDELLTPPQSSAAMRSNTHLADRVP